jgi:uncharacterized membrane protein
LRKYVLNRFQNARWIAAGKVLLAVLVVAGAGVAVARGSDADLVQFVGRFHPLIVHLPIGFLLLAGLVEVIGRTRRFADLRPAALMPVLLGLGALSTLAAILTGNLLARSGEYDAALVGRHQQWGFLLGLVVVVAVASAWWRTRQDARGPRVLYGATFAMALVLVGVTGHYGGALTHGETYLTEHMPRVPLLTSARASGTPGPVDLSTTRVFEALVAPTLDARCVQCHGPARQAGKLRLDSPEAIGKGGESGPALVAGDAMRSELVRRIFLPASDKKLMPPKGHPVPSHADVAVLRWWIDQGASFDQVLSDAQVTPEIERAITDRLGPVDFSAPAILSVRVAPGDPAAIEALRALKMRVEPLRADTSLLMVQAPPAARAFSDADLTHVEALAPQVAWLDLGGTQVTDAGLTRVLPKLVHLWRLSLDRTTITDRALAPLETLSRLEAVNLYATQVGDAGLASLAKLPRLRAVYAWQTQVTPQGTETLRAANAKVRVNVGAPPSPVVEAEPTAGTQDRKS